MTADATTPAAVVVNYRARDHLLACVASLRAEGVEELVVVDNDSRDGSEEALADADPRARFIQTGANLGFGAAANRGVRATHAPYVLVCNPDIVLQPGALKSLGAVLDADARVAFVGPRIDNPDGTRYPSARTFPSLVDSMGHAFLGLIAPNNRWSRRYKLEWESDEAGPVDWVSGACFLARREAWTGLGGFDESYFMYLEDVDLCWRAWKTGWRVIHEPAARVVHVQGVSTDQRPYRMIVEHHRSLWRFAWRTTRGPRRLALPPVAVGLVARTLLAWAHHRFGRVPARR